MHAVRKGFTLIELLIVIGILAVLATITVLVLNPAQLFAQARDSQRISDLGTIKSGINLYLATVSSPTMAVAGTCGTSFWSSLDDTTVPTPTSTFSGTPTIHVNSGLRTVSGEGWVPISFASTTGGATLSTLPIDPVNNNQFRYNYQCNSGARTFELNADMESTRYANGGSDDVESKDGGNNDEFYETGTDPGLNL